MAGHSILSPSSADRWMVCPGSVRMSQGYPNKSSKYSAEGTVAHEIAAWCLTQDRRPTERLGDAIHCDGYEIRVDSEMVEAVETYVDNIAGYRRPGAELFVEQRMSIAWYAEKGDEGTSDCVIIDLPAREIQVHDYKHGKGVLVAAEDNRQMKIYALSAIREFFPLLGLDDSDIDTVRLVIHQPRANKAPSEWDCTIGELREFELEVGTAARSAMALLECSDDDHVATFCTPSEKGCKFCPAKAECGALEKLVTDSVDDVAKASDFDEVGPEHLPGAIKAIPRADNAALGRVLPVLDLIEDWCSAVRETAYSRALDGQQIPGFKLVAGKPGARKWADEEEAEKVLKSFRLKVDEMYEHKLISPTKAEKLIEKESPRRWEKLQPLIARDDGKPKLVPESAKGEPIVINQASSFDAVEESLA